MSENKTNTSELVAKTIDVDDIIPVRTCHVDELVAFKSKAIYDDKGKLIGVKDVKEKGWVKSDIK